MSQEPESILMSNQAMSTWSDQQFIVAVELRCAANPSLVSSIIKAASRGVEEFAQNQKDHSSKMVNYLLDILDESHPDNIKTKYFTLKEIIGKIGMWYEGTDGFSKLKKKFAKNLVEDKLKI